MSHSTSLHKALVKWESKEHSVEEKLDELQKAVYHYVGFKKSPDYYCDHGKFFERFVAGFISRFFWALKDMSFLLLDPLHIFDLIVAFVKQLFTHPIKLLKSILDIWTWYFTHGAFGWGMMTADALVAFIIAASATVLTRGIVKGVSSAASAIPETFMSNLTYVPEKIYGIGSGIKKTITSTADVFKRIQQNPQLVLAEAGQSIRKGISYGVVREFKMYTVPFLEGHSK